MEKKPITNIEQVPHELESRLPEIASQVIQNNQKLTAEQKIAFLENPDSPEEHEPMWHQWGIISYSIEFRKAYETLIQNYLIQWQLEDFVSRYLEEKIDGITKGQLLKIAMPLHDLGKFNKGVKKQDGQLKWDFSGHDKMSEEIIKTDLNESLRQFGLTDDQIDYIAFCAGHHFELAFFREEAKKSPKGYTIDFVKSDEFSSMLEKYLPRFTGYKTEIGLLFFADTLAKVGIHIRAESDADIDQQKESVKEEITRQGLNPKIISGILQEPVNIEAVKRYFEIIKDRAV